LCRRAEALATEKTGGSLQRGCGAPTLHALVLLSLKSVGKSLKK
jgi:hypothetical protein